MTARARCAAALLTISLFAVGCGSSDPDTASAASDAVSAEAEPTATPAPEPTATTAPTATPEPEPTATPAPEPTAAPATPQAQPDDDAPTPPAATIGTGCSNEAVASIEPTDLISGGNTYSWFGDAPESYVAGQPHPLILNFHGLGSNGGEQVAFSEIQQSADPAGFITVHPTGQPNDNGQPSWELLQVDDPARDDVAFVEDLIAAASDVWCVDQNRIYAMGMSNGGFFTAVLVCALGDRIAAGASVAGVSFDDINCAPDAPTPYLAFHGTDDAVVPYAGGGESTLNGGTANAFFEQKMLEEFGQFAERFGCGTPTASDFSDTVTQHDFAACDAGAELTFYEIADGGHSWPGSTLSSLIDFVGVTDMSIPASDLIVEFFARHELNS